MQPQKVTSLFDLIDQGDPKAAMKTFTKDLEKNGKKLFQDPLTKAHTLTVKAVVFSANGNIQEARLSIDEAFSEIQSLAEDPTKIKAKEFIETTNRI